MARVFSPWGYVPALRRLVLDRIHDPFAWGVRDCACLAFDAVAAVVGRDTAAAIRGRWFDARSAARTLRSLGGWAGVARACGWVEVAPEQMREGDVLLLHPRACRGELTKAGALAVCVAGRAVAQGGAGLVWLPLDAAQRAWRAA